MTNKIYLCSFASSDLDRSVKRFKKQANELNVYEKINIYRPKNLSNELKEKVNKLLKIGKKRLYAYAIWKPDIILDNLNKIPDNSILHYADIGCHFNLKGIDRLKEYFTITDKHSMLTFEYSRPKEKFGLMDYKFQQYPEYKYTKADLINYFGLNFDSSIINTPQIWSGSFFVKKCDFILNLLNSWKKVFDQINLIDDSDSVLTNHKEFYENRHDQSALSIICKKNNIFSLSVLECEWVEFNGKRIWTHLNNYPILAKRDLKYNIIKRFIKRQSKNLKRLKKKISNS